MDNIVKFDKPYKFEGKEYDSLDLSGMEKMTVQDLIDIQKNIGNELGGHVRDGNDHFFCTGNGR